MFTCFSERGAERLLPPRRPQPWRSRSAAPPLGTTLAAERRRALSPTAAALLNTASYCCRNSRSLLSFALAKAAGAVLFSAVRQKTVRIPFCFVYPDAKISQYLKKQYQTETKVSSQPSIHHPNPHPNHHHHHHHHQIVDEPAKKSARDSTRKKDPLKGSLSRLPRARFTAISSSLSSIIVLTSIT